MASWTTAPITQGFGPTDEKLDGGYLGYANFNKGYDYGVPAGTPIDTTVGGTVIAAGDQGDGWGISVKVRDASGYVHNYGHLESVSVKPGDQVGAGSIVGSSGNTGKSTGDHLSYDVLDPQGNFVDPKRWVSGEGMATETPPFGSDEYQQKYATYTTLKMKLDNWPVDPYTKVPEPGWEDIASQVANLEWEISEYVRIRDANGGNNIDGELARLRYQNESDPRLIDAQNSANAWARQQEINRQATTGTQNDLQEQRLTADSADASGRAYKESNHFTQPFGFRVGSTDLPTEEELFAKQIARASKDLPEVTPIPYAQPLGAFGSRAGTTANSKMQTQSTGAMPTEADFAAAQNTFKNVNAEGRWQGPINSTPPASGGPSAVPGSSDPLRSPGLGQQFASAFGGTTLGRLGSVFNGGGLPPAPVNNLQNWPDTQAESDTLPPLPSRVPQQFAPYPNVGIRRFAGTIFGGR